MNKLIVILGPTSSGKSSLAIKLARKFSGEIISVDSRQVYKGMDLGTGKVPISHFLRSKKSAKSSTPAKAGIYSGGVRHHLLDIASPKKQFTVSDFKRLAFRSVEQIQRQNKIPFLVGGSPFYIYSVIDNLQIPEVKPNLKLRKQLAKKSLAELFRMLKRFDPKRAKNIDKNNPRRLIRAIEIVKATGRPVPHPSPLNPQPCLILGIKKAPEELKKLIKIRLESRLKQGMVSEVKKLLKAGVSHKRLFELGLEYRYISEYILGKLTYQKMKEQLFRAIIKFSKRQMTWFKRDSRIQWIKNSKQAEKLIKKFF
ncbi:MAG: tRNA (adenosine(37)-N6)-dimethylallyltransferase MiaA [Candidatus Doudnabacteria bacterium]|nr:tRNA (adenosine(37)-N6)-dimethylallyltransferase MiaA [Candidatus Doudnabacteria bacterium]